MRARWSTRSWAIAFVTAVCVPLVACADNHATGRPAQPPRDSAASPVGSPTPPPGEHDRAPFRSARDYPEVAPPVRLRIPAIRVSSGLQRLGRAADGVIDVPQRADVAGWWAEGPRPGQHGPAVILGHVDSHSRPGVFFRLHELTTGALIFVDRPDGSTAQFRVTGVARVAKDRFPTELVYAPTLEVALRLVTCGGTFDRASGHYRDNVIVFADAT